MFSDYPWQKNNKTNTTFLILNEWALFEDVLKRKWMHTPLIYKIIEASKYVSWQPYKVHNSKPNNLYITIIL